MSFRPDVNDTKNADLDLSSQALGDGPFDLFLAEPSTVTASLFAPNRIDDPAFAAPGRLRRGRNLSTPSATVRRLALA
ncbi:MAG: hypothetical protein ACRDWD_15060 [Acidimicrobiia bacterium]